MMYNGSHGQGRIRQHRTGHVRGQERVKDRGEDRTGYDISGQGTVNRGQGTEDRGQSKGDMG